jgi:hypothetical protein
MQTVNYICCDIYEYQNVFPKSAEPKISADAAERVTEGNIWI